MLYKFVYIRNNYQIKSILSEYPYNTPCRWDKLQIIRRKGFYSMKEKLFNKGFVLITLINFVVYLVYYLLMVIIAVIAQEELNASLGEAGFASGIYIIGTLLARLYMGKKLELFGRKRVLRFGILFS